MNEPRTLPYAFRVFECDDIVWLYDDSERTYCCSLTPSIWAEPLYWMDGDCDSILPDATYWDVKSVKACGGAPIDGLDPEDVALDGEPRAAWDAAREEACANCRI